MKVYYEFVLGCIQRSRPCAACGPQVGQVGLTGRQGAGGLSRKVISLVLIGKFQTDWLKVLLLGKAETAVSFGLVT